MNVYIWTSGTLKNDYIGERQPFIPSSDTLYYFPLQWDVLDKSGNWRTLSQSWTQQTLGREFVLQWDSSVTLDTTLTNTKTTLAWVYIKNYGWYWQQFILNTIYWSLLLNNKTNTTRWPVFYYYSWEYNVEYKVNATINKNQWSLVALTLDTNKYLRWYINWTQYNIWTVYNYEQNRLAVTANWVSYTDSSLDVIFSNVIWEAKTRSKSELDDYYNNTKSNYWL